jgi:hypothetical protein
MEQKLSVTVDIRPCHPGNMMILDVLNEEQCSSEIRSLFINRIHQYKKDYTGHELFKDGYPNNSKHFKLIPIGQKEKPDRFVPFAALWLPSILFNIETVKLKLLPEMQGKPIVGCDTNFSFFGESSAEILCINHTPGKEKLVLEKRAIFELPKDWLCLVEA